MTVRILLQTALLCMCCAVLAPAWATEYTTLVEPQNEPVQTLSPVQLYQDAGTDEALFDAVTSLIRGNKSETAWDIIEAHGSKPTKPYFEARLAAINARMSKASKLSKLSWARRLNETCSGRVEVEPRDETALECLVKFHDRAPRIAGGDAAAGKQALADLKSVNPPRGLLVEAEIVFPKNAEKARALVDEALAYDSVYDEGLMHAAMVYGYFEDWDATLAALERIDPSSAVGTMRFYQLGKLSATLGARLKQGEEALLTFLQGDTIYYGVDFRGPAHWRLGQIFRHEEKYDLAKLAFERALGHQPRLSAAKRDLNDLEKLIKKRKS